MSINIIDIEVCHNCKKETCAYIDRVTKSNTVFASEETVCPTGVLQSNPSQMSNLPFNDKKCIDCGLCVGYCSKQNLNITIDTPTLNLEHCNSIGMNILVSNYLNKIFPFAANSNRNSSVTFDGYVEIGEEKEAFVEVDEKDALECCRNLLGDFLLYEGQFSSEVNVGLIVLEEIPPLGSNIYTVVDKMHTFPRLEGKEIYFTTISFLRHLFLQTNTAGSYIFEKVFFNPLRESLAVYQASAFAEVGLVEALKRTSDETSDKSR